MQKFTFKIIVFIIFIEVVITFYLWLYLHTKISVIFSFLSILVLFILSYLIFSFISRKIITLDKRSTFFKTSNISEHLCIILRLVIGIIFFLLIKDLISYIYAFIHETGHAVVLIFQGYEVNNIVININGTSYTESTFLPFTMDTAIIFLAGSVTSCSINLILIILITLKDDIEMEIFLPLYGLFGNNILNEIYYWVKGPFEVGTDAWHFIVRIHSLDATLLSNIMTLIMYQVILLLICLLIFKLTKFLIKKIYLPDLSIFLMERY